MQQRNISREVNITNSLQRTHFRPALKVIAAAVCACFALSQSNAVFADPARKYFKERPVIQVAEANIFLPPGHFITPQQQVAVIELKQGVITDFGVIEKALNTDSVKVYTAKGDLPELPKNQKPNVEFGPDKNLVTVVVGNNKYVAERLDTPQIKKILGNVTANFEKSDSPVGLMFQIKEGANKEYIVVLNNSAVLPVAMAQQRLVAQNPPPQNPQPQKPVRGKIEREPIKQMKQREAKYRRASRGSSATFWATLVITASAAIYYFFVKRPSDKKENEEVAPPRQPDMEVSATTDDAGEPTYGAVSGEQVFVAGSTGLPEGIESDYVFSQTRDGGADYVVDVDLTDGKQKGIFITIDPQAGDFSDASEITFYVKGVAGTAYPDVFDVTLSAVEGTAVREVATYRVSEIGDEFKKVVLPLGSIDAGSIDLITITFDPALTENRNGSLVFDGLIELPEADAGPDDFRAPDAPAAEVTGVFRIAGLRDAYQEFQWNNAGKSFIDGVNWINQDTALPYDHLDVLPGGAIAQPVPYTTITNVGLYLSYLAAVAEGDVTGVTAQERALALARLDEALTTLTDAQRHNGLFYRFYELTPDGAVPSTDEISTIDNGNLSASLASVAGAFLDDIQNPDDPDLALKQSIVNKVRSILDGQDYSFLYDSAKGLMHQSYCVESDSFSQTYLDQIYNESRIAVLWATLSGDIPEDALNNMANLRTQYTDSSGSKCDVITPYNGAAFQALMSLLFFNERELSPDGLAKANNNYVYAALDWMNRNGYPAIPSASSDPADGDVYNGYCGIKELAFARNLADESVFAPHAIALASLVDLDAGNYLTELLDDKPQMVGALGIRDAISVDGQVSDRYLSLDQLMLSLALLGDKNANRVDAYLQSIGKKDELANLLGAIKYDLAMPKCGMKPQPPEETVKVDPACGVKLSMATDSVRNGAVDMVVDYSVTDGVTRGVYAKVTPAERDLSGQEELVFYLRGDEQAGYPDAVCVELKDGQGRIIKFVAGGISADYKRYSIPLDIAAAKMDISDVRTVTLIFDPDVVGNKEGRLYIDGLFEPAQASVGPDDQNPSPTNAAAASSGTFAVNQEQATGVALAQVCQGVHSGATDVTLEYDVTDGVTKGAFAVIADGDISGIDSLNLYVRGDGASYPSKFWIEVKDADGKVAKYLVTGITGEFQKVSIPAAQLTGVIDLTSVREMVVLIDPGILQAGEKQGKIIIDGIFEPAQAQVSPDDGLFGTSPASQAMGTFASGQQTATGIDLNYTASDVHFGPLDAVLQYDVTDGVTKGAFSVIADGHNDLSHLDAINLYARGDGASYPSKFWIEIKDTDGKVAKYLVTGVTDDFKKISIPAAQLAVAIDITSVKEIVVVIDPSILQTGEKQGKIIIDGIFEPAQAQVSPDDGLPGTCPTSKKMGTFASGRDNPTGIDLKYTASNVHYGVLDAVLQYDVTDGVTKGAFSVLADGHNDLSHLDAINIYAKGDSKNFWIEVKELADADGNVKVVRYLVTGITGEFQKVSIPASQLAGVIDLTKVSEIVVIVDPNVLPDSQKQGTLVIDGVLDYVS